MSSIVGDVKPRIVRCEFCVFLQDMMTLERLDSFDELTYLLHLRKSHGLEK